MLVTNQTTADIYFGPLHLGAGVGTTLTVDDTSDTSLYLTNDGVADALNAAYLANNITVSGQALPFPRPTGTPQILHGDGAPEGLVYSTQGSLYMRRDGTGPDSLYVKTTGVTISTGWEVFGAAVGGPGTEWDYAQITTNASGSSPVTVVTGNTVTYDGTRVRIEAFASYADCTATGTATGIEGQILRDGAVIHRWKIAHDANTSNLVWTGTSFAAFYDTPTAGSHTYAFHVVGEGGGTTTVTVHAGNGGAADSPAYLRVTKA